MTRPQTTAEHEILETFVHEHRRLLVLTGAGCSTESGIQDYRDVNGDWKRARPITWQAFMGDGADRQRYWARSLIGWRHLEQARPNDAHRALARLEARGTVELVLTQNVDGLHQAAGSTRVIDLHGRIDQVRCMRCARQTARLDLQSRLTALNPAWAQRDAAAAPDGDADLDGEAFSTFRVPDCRHCGGILKPDVVFFGEDVPAARKALALDHLAAADAVLVVGSSLMVPSGYRFVQRAAEAGKPIGAVTLGRTRADSLFAFKVARPCAKALAFLL
ncbi:NAD-dependent protein deacetylase [Gluconacetobacter sacchari]|uniref:NAD-dependent protein deacetylase n=2 Tax=Gluconacetobacter sacchari TaxID=92759 RepID=A0A7W4IGL1_9PROT|nr:NAD-dependent protein deacetylase [Gluconacetobacter sacchari]MBB2162496.1 NAD-dependent protein deacetylase [Gluconacetobacter sacchari]